MSELKRLAILEKVVRNNMNEIKETDICKTQKEDTVETEDLKDLIWMYLNLNVNSENINNWKVNMKFKNQYEHLKNKCTEMQQ